MELDASSASDHADVRNKIVKLKCSVMNYDWGRKGAESNVARLHALNRGIGVEKDKAYAEFWMGTHGSGPSYVMEEQKVHDCSSIMDTNKSSRSNVMEEQKVHDCSSVMEEQKVHDCSSRMDTNKRGSFKVMEEQKVHDCSSRMDTRVSGPSYVMEEQKVNGCSSVGVANGGGNKGDNDFCCGPSLATWIQQNPTVLGGKVLAKWGPNLPFLFKVLSVEKALSIQAHPDKEFAAILHRKQPNIYKDDNHKPEMALALSNFEALCGFVSLEELKGVIHSVPEIEEVVGRACAYKVLEINELDGEEKTKEALRSLFSEIMSASKEMISQAVSRLSSRLNLKNEGRGLTEKEKLVLRLEQQYPADVGVIAAFLLNHIKLNPGEALYLGANEPHAYIYGECIECMATSDNVVRAGLTPKYLDVQTLCSMLTYKQGLPDILQGEPVNSYITRYHPPFEEFEIDRCNLPEETETVFQSVPSPSIFLVLQGKGTMSTIASRETIVEGDVLFTPADTEVSISTKSGLTSDKLLCSFHYGISEQVPGLTLYRTGVNSRSL